MLTINLLSNGNIQLSSENITDFIANIEDYTKLKIEGVVNCCGQKFSIIDLVPLAPNTKYTVVGNTIEIKPAFFNITGTSPKFMDGVFHFEVKLFKPDDTFTYEENCSFIDITYKCKLSGMLKSLLGTDEDKNVGMVAFLLHYALVTGSNCGCNCKEMCDAFRELANILAPITNQSNNCGC